MWTGCMSARCVRACVRACAHAVLHRAQRKSTSKQTNQHATAPTLPARAIDNGNDMRWVFYSILFLFDCHDLTILHIVLKTNQPRVHILACEVDTIMLHSIRDGETEFRDTGASDRTALPLCIYVACIVFFVCVCDSQKLGTQFTLPEVGRITRTELILIDFAFDTFLNFEM